MGELEPYMDENFVRPLAPSPLYQGNASGSGPPGRNLPDRRFASAGAFPSSPSLPPPFYPPPCPPKPRLWLLLLLQIKQIWYAVGENVQVKMIRDKYSGQNAGYCFVDFGNHPSAVKALATLQGTFMPGTNRAFRLNWASGGGMNDRRLIVWRIEGCCSGFTFSVRCDFPKRRPDAGVLRFRWRLGVGSDGSNALCEHILRDTGCSLEVLSIILTRLRGHVDGIPGPISLVEDCEGSNGPGNWRFPRYVPIFLCVTAIYCTKVAVAAVSDGHNCLAGYGFVRFHDEADQNRALTEMQGAVCGSRPMRISMATPKNKAGDNQLGGMAGGMGSAGGGQAYHPHAGPIAVPQGLALNQYADPNNTTVFVGGLSGVSSEDELRGYAPLPNPSYDLTLRGPHLLTCCGQIGGNKLLCAFRRRHLRQNPARQGLRFRPVHAPPFRRDGDRPAKRHSNRQARSSCIFSDSRSFGILPENAHALQEIRESDFLGEKPSQIKGTGTAYGISRTVASAGLYAPFFSRRMNKAIKLTEPDVRHQVYPQAVHNPLAAYAAYGM
ncbi:MAG: hypothetical protein BJ554DRAFT_5623, partial [Olpidium bornovanus]